MLKNGLRLYKTDYVVMLCYLTLTACCDFGIDMTVKDRRTETSADRSL